MRDHHVDVTGPRLEFQFRGKSGRRHTVRVDDRRLARIVKACQDIPGYELFQYIDEQGERQCVDSGDVNAYLREIGSPEVSARVFRTWAGTVAAIVSLRARAGGGSGADLKRDLVATIREVADELGNTPAVCRKSYVHPAVIECWERGELHDTLSGLRVRRGPRGLSAEERLAAAFLELVRRRQARASTLSQSLRRSLRRRVAEPPAARRPRQAGTSSGRARRPPAVAHLNG
jgi:DNA topoisomerase-1